MNTDKISSNDIHIIFATDKNYTPHLCAAISSILTNHCLKRPIHFHILNSDLEEEEIFNIKALANIQKAHFSFYDTSAIDFSELPLNRDHISVATYYRLYILDLISSSIEKALYLDCDIIVKDDIEILFNTNIDLYLAGVIEDEGSKTQSMRLGFPDGTNYFNAGVLLLNLKKLREINFKESCLNWFSKNSEKILLQDQDILNAIFKDNVLYLPLNWNAHGRLYRKNELEHFYSLDEEQRARRNPSIIHFTDKNKPWDIKCNHPLKYAYWHFLKLTNYKKNDFIFKLKSIFKSVLHINHTNNHIRIRIFGISIFKTSSKKMNSLSPTSIFFRRLLASFIPIRKHRIKYRNKWLKKNKNTSTPKIDLYRRIIIDYVVDNNRHKTINVILDSYCIKNIYNSGQINPLIIGTTLSKKYNLNLRLITKKNIAPFLPFIDYLKKLNIELPSKIESYCLENNNYFMLPSGKNDIYFMLKRKSPDILSKEFLSFHSLALITTDSNSYPANHISLQVNKPNQMNNDNHSLSININHFMPSNILDSRQTDLELSRIFNLIQASHVHFKN